VIAGRLGFEAMDTSELEAMVDAGRLGQKTGKGFYAWKPEKKGPPKKQSDPEAKALVAGPATGNEAVTDEEVQLAARRAQAHDFIERLPDGYETRVGERGLTLSGGQRQRIAIARALLADPRILILDEATSNIDRPSEILIEQAFDTLLRGRTSVIIAHRLATVRRADEILVIEKGHVTQRGTEAELLAEDGPFRRLAETLHGTSIRDVA